MPKTIFGGSHTKLVETLLEARTRVGLTQAEVASRIGRDQTFVSLIERGQRRVDVVEFIALARAMNADPTDLFGDLMSRISKGEPADQPDG